MGPGLGYRTAAQDGDFGDFGVLKQDVESGGTDQARGAGEDDMHDDVAAIQSCNFVSVAIIAPANNRWKNSHTIKYGAPKPFITPRCTSACTFTRGPLALRTRRWGVDDSNVHVCASLMNRTVIPVQTE